MDGRGTALVGEEEKGIALHRLGTRDERRQEMLTLRSGSEAVGPVMSTISLHVLSAYGVAWTAYRIISRRSWAGGVAAASFFAVPLMAAVQGSGHEYLVYALVLVATAVVPGFRLRAAARA